MATWYRFKALGTEWTDVVSGLPNTIKEVQGSGRQTYPSNGYSYIDFLTDEVVGAITFGDGYSKTIEATQVQVTLEEFSSSGSFVAGTGLGGAAIGYANTDVFGSVGTLNSGTLPALPARYEGGQITAGSVIFGDIYPPVVPGALMLITTPILLQLSINDNPIDLTGMDGNVNGTSFDSFKTPPRTAFGFEDGETYTFSMTWGELVEVAPPSIRRKLRVKGVGQLNP